MCSHELPSRHRWKDEWRLCFTQDKKRYSIDLAQVLGLAARRRKTATLTSHLAVNYYVIVGVAYSHLHIEVSRIDSWVPFRILKSRAYWVTAGQNKYSHQIALLAVPSPIFVVFRALLMCHKKEITLLIKASMLERGQSKSISFWVSAILNVSGVKESLLISL